MSKDVYTKPQGRHGAIGGYKRDPEFDTLNLAVYINDQSHAIIAIRGTADLDDMVENLKILQGDMPNALMLASATCLRKVIKKRSPQRVSLTGHSLGGCTAYYFWRTVAPLMAGGGNDVVQELFARCRLGAEVLRGLSALPQVDFTEIHLFNPGASPWRDVKPTLTNPSGVDSAGGLSGRFTARIVLAELAGVKVPDYSFADFFGGTLGMNQMLSATMFPPPTDPVKIHHIMGDPISMQWNGLANCGTRIDYTVSLGGPMYKHSMDRFLE